MLRDKKSLPPTKVNNNFRLETDYEAGTRIKSVTGTRSGSVPELKAETRSITRQKMVYKAYGSRTPAIKKMLMVLPAIGMETEISGRHEDE
ncbi:hypothetical protein EVAR_12244_1 [Eumeta japonica]|uniref:Uncharacterized protein n=1 Tax=Eumeta variegata TaxID=151549 RepID=A0A4C1TU41_EUMVA|nr:hypothetical protein EVAR_12244_1 [Eumeta japonica]